tara:strand:+ start:308 stop:490 length:183 start_codon:yes stop_codon:yes gene_type:complete
MAYPTNPKYKLIKSIFTNTDVGVMFQEGTVQTSVPFASGNTDYQRYLEWVAAGNTAEEAD